MLDFTSSLYLGMKHPSWSIRPWRAMTAGVPAALMDRAETGDLQRRLADLTGCEAAVVGASTLHIFWDLLGGWADAGRSFYADDGLYAIARWGLERAASRGAPVRSFAHFDPQALRRAIDRGARRRLKPVIVADGFCPGCGHVAPIQEYLDAIRPFGGTLLLDDTQALGVLGTSPDAQNPYGRGGGGALQWSGVRAPEIVMVSSLAKGFGAPLAMLAASRRVVRAFTASSETRVHCSPASFPAMRAAERALDLNTEACDSLRRRLVALVRRLRSGLRATDFQAPGTLFPVQTLVGPEGMSLRAIHARLLEHGVKAVMHRARHGTGARLSFIVTARHRPEEIDRGVELLSQAATDAAVPARRAGST